MSHRDLCIMACVFCRDPLFHQWANGWAEEAIESEGGAKAFILDVCGIDSRNDLDTNPDAAQRFHDLVRKPFLAWKEGRA